MKIYKESESCKYISLGHRPVFEMPIGDFLNEFEEKRLYIDQLYRMFKNEISKVDRDSLLIICFDYEAKEQVAMLIFSRHSKECLEVANHIYENLPGNWDKESLKVIEEAEEKWYSCCE